MVGASGFEPPASWSRTSSATLRNGLLLNTPSEKQTVKPLVRVWLVVSGCSQSSIGSLQNPLQSKISAGEKYMPRRKHRTEPVIRARVP
jgi:hypothetical protein